MSRSVRTNYYIIFYLIFKLHSLQYCLLPIKEQFGSCPQGQIIIRVNLYLVFIVDKTLQ